MNIPNKRLVLIDGNAILHRAYHALPSSLTSKDNQPINAVYGFVSILLRIIQDLRPTHITVCFDEKEPTFRHVEFKDYQAQRPEIDSKLAGQFEITREVISAFGIPIESKPGFEADDVIATIASQASKQDAVEDVVIVTGDRDILQLVNPKVKVYLPTRGLSEGVLMDTNGVVEKMGVRPSQIVDYKALVGDPSDNYPGVAGIGPKTAKDLLDKYGDLTNIYRNIGKIKAPVAKKLKEGKENAYLSQKLAQIVSSVPDIEFDSKASAAWDVSGKPVLDLFAKIGFRTLTERVKKIGQELAKQDQMRLV